jgi:hypothetical protein
MPEQGTNSGLNGVPLRDAAERLGLTVDAVRMRIRRGGLQAYKIDGKWFVHLPEHETEHLGEQPEQSAEQQGEQFTERDQDTAIGALREIITRQDREIAFLRAEVESRRQSESEFRVILARQSAEITNLASRLQALTSGMAPEAPERPQSTPEPPDEPQDPGFVYREPEPERRPWWKVWDRGTV